MSEKNNIWVFSPLSLLLLLFGAPWVATRLSSIATHSSTRALAYKFIIPLVGLSFGAVLFLSILNGNFKSLISRLHSLATKRGWHLVAILGITHVVLFSCLAILRYNSLHGNLFDLGIELQRLWVATNSNLLNLTSLSGSFRPLVSLYTFAYKLSNSLPFVFILQALITTSAVVPLYLLAKNKLNTPLFSLVVAIIFLYYPPLQYNSFNDLHLDHLYIPFMMWAFYFSRNEAKTSVALFFVTLCALIKEPLILGAAFFGLYLIINKKNYLSGSIIFASFILLFYLVTFVMLPQVSVATPGKSVVQSSNYSYLLTAHKDFFLPIVKQLFSLKKITYLIFLLAPLFFLPFFSLSTFLPAIPLIAISILSLNPAHCAVNSHYTVGVIPPAFVAFLSSLDKIKNRWGDKTVEAVLGWSLILTIFFNIAHSPAPISVNFWDTEGAGGIYHYSQYYAQNHEKLLKYVVDKLIPQDPKVKISLHSKIAHIKLSSRYFSHPFPSHWGEADYILLDHSRLPMVMDKIDKREYWRHVKQVEESNYFKQIFNKDDIVLYRRVPITNNNLKTNIHLN